MPEVANWTRTFVKSTVAVIVAFGAIQFIPYGRDHTNPPVQAGPNWDSRRTEELFFRACKNCHSNETEWPWYSEIAPSSWLVRHDVTEARARFNVSEWGRKKKNKGYEAADEVNEGDMPPWYYVLLHPEARFSKDERKEFADGLVRTFGEGPTEKER